MIGNVQTIPFPAKRLDYDVLASMNFRRKPRRLSLIKLSRYIDRQISPSGRHSSRVAEWALQTARCLGLTPTEMHTIYWAGLLHDVGKVGIPLRVLNKPGRLTATEWQAMQRHPAIGAQLASSDPNTAFLAPVIAAHHEKYDGSGYPAGLSGKRIPLAARVLCVADSFEAMTSLRSYNHPMDYQVAINELLHLSGRHFDGQVVLAFLEVLGADPTAALPL